MQDFVKNKNLQQLNIAAPRQFLFLMSLHAGRPLFRFQVPFGRGDILMHRAACPVLHESIHTFNTSATSGSGVK